MLVSCYSPGLYEKRLKWLEDLQIGQHDPGVYKLGSKKRRIWIQDKSQVTRDSRTQGYLHLENRAGQMPQFIPPVKEPLKKMCVRPFRMLNINWRGDALICCDDYSGKYSFGNVRDMSLVDLWSHPVILYYRAKLLNKNRNTPLCKGCDFNGGSHKSRIGAENV